MRLVLAVILALALVPQTQPVVTWRDATHISVSWPQEVSGERCLSKEASDGALYEYGCFWFFGEVGGGGRMTLPISGSTPDAYPQVGDTIVVGGVSAIVPAQHFAYLPTILR